MPVALTIREAEHHLSDPGVDALVRDLGIPAQPQIVSALGQEMARPEPDLQRIVRIVASDVALTAAVLRVVNSPAYGLRRRIETLGQAISLLGLRQVAVLVTGIVVRKSLPAEGPQFQRFWDVSAKRSWAMALLARELGGVEVDVAQTFGLFCDVGIPLLMRRLPDYSRTLLACDAETARSFTAVEQAAHHTDHALVGALMARSWGVSQAVCLAIRVHHDLAIFGDPQTPAAISRMVAMALLADHAVDAAAALPEGVEWAKGGAGAMAVLGLSAHDMVAWLEQLADTFSDGAV